MKKTFRGTMIDIALNIIIPYAIYTLAHQYFGLSEIASLTLSSVYPLFDILREYTKDRTLNFISVIVLMATITGIIGALIGGDPRLILLRESLFTFLLGIACFLTLITKKPLMFYFAREFSAGKDPAKREQFEKLLEKKPAFSFFRLLTFVWGIVYVVEFLLKCYLIYTFSISTNLIIGPISTYAFTFAALAWTFWYSNRWRNQFKKHS